MVPVGDIHGLSFSALSHIPMSSPLLPVAISQPNELALTPVSGLLLGEPKLRLSFILQVTMIPTKLLHSYLDLENL